MLWWGIGNDQHPARTKERHTAGECEIGITKRAGGDHIELSTAAGFADKVAHITGEDIDTIRDTQPRTRTAQQVHSPFAAIGEGDPQVGESTSDHQARQSAARTEIEQVNRRGGNCIHKRRCVSDGTDQ